MEDSTIWGLPSCKLSPPYISQATPKKNAEKGFQIVIDDICIYLLDLPTFLLSILGCYTNLPTTDTNFGVPIQSRSDSIGFLSSIQGWNQRVVSNASYPTNHSLTQGLSWIIHLMNYYQFIDLPNDRCIFDDSH